MRPSFPTVPIMSGVAIATSKSSKPLLDLRSEVARADDVGAGLLGFLGLLAFREDRDRDVLPVPCGSMSVPRSC